MDYHDELPLLSTSLKYSLPVSVMKITLKEVLFEKHAVYTIRAFFEFPINLAENNGIFEGNS